ERLYKRAFFKKSIFLHHTAGNHDPRSTKSWWQHPQNPERVATAYVIGGVSPDGNQEWDGKVLKVMEEKSWAYHVGLGNLNDLDKRSVGIEICNVGYLYQLPKGFYSPVIDGIIPDDQVVELEKPFRGFRFYHKYSNAQLDTLKELILQIADRQSIDLKEGLQEWIQKESLEIPRGLENKEFQQWLNEHRFVGRNGKKLAEDGIFGAQTFWAARSVGKDAFEYNTQCLSGHPGLWTHTNVRDIRYDGKFEKSDCSPQPELKFLILDL
ncbi:MAG: N-acetylmuramoyl-L-alanine amidase, partial [Bacteroidota bacterium]